MAINNFIPTIWSENLLRSMDKQFVAVSNCNREYEGEIKEKGNTVKICGVGAITISDYTKDTDMDAPDTLSDSVKNLVINRAKYFNFQIDDVDAAQCSPKLMDAAMRNAASALANEADAYVYSLYNEAGSTVTCASVTYQNVIDYLIEARTALFKKDVANASDIVIEVSPEIAALILKAKVTLASDNGEALENGCIGSIGGCKIFVSNNIVKTTESNVKYFKCIARTRRAVAFADQLSEIDAYRPELRFADAVKGLHLYGAKVIYPDEMVQLNLGIAASN